jgi:hypothetical protein
MAKGSLRAEDIDAIHLDGARLPSWIHADTKRDLER